MRKMLIAVYSDIFTEELVYTFQSDYHIYTCSRGDDALHLLQRLKPDVLIIMLSLPGITGMEVLQQTQYKPSAIFALTTYLSESIVYDAQAAGVNVLIRLPCTMAQITQRIQDLLQR